MPDDGTVAGEERRFRASDGYAFYFRHWTPAETPKAYVVSLHGIQSHSGWYGYSCGRLAAAGFDVRFLDRRGSGLNDVDRGHAVHWRRLVADVAQFLAQVRYERDRDAPASPVVLSAVSWGARLAAVVAAERHDLIDALALLYPGICARVRPTWFQNRLLSLGVAAGKLRKTAAIPLDDPTLFTDDPRRQAFIREDPLALREATVAFFAASRELTNRAIASPEGITRPVLMMLAGRDRIIDNDAMRKFYERLGTADRTLIEYPNAAHTLEFEPDRDRFIDDLIAWFNGRVVEKRGLRPQPEFGTANYVNSVNHS